MCGHAFALAFVAFITLMTNSVGNSLYIQHHVSIRMPWQSKNDLFRVGLMLKPGAWLCYRDKAYNHMPIGVEGGLMPKALTG